mgnify:CR=1 FL=1
MPGVLRTPTDMSAPPPVGATMSPPIIPGLTQLPPGVMRALLRGGQEEAGEQGSEGAEEQQEPQTEQSILAEFGNLFWKAGEYPGLQDVMLSFVKALKKASDQRNAVSSQTLLRMPIPMIAPEESAPRGDLLSLLGGQQ